MGLLGDLEGRDGTVRCSSLVDRASRAKRILALRERFDRVTLTHVPRAQNKVADALANEALDQVS